MFDGCNDSKQMIFTNYSVKQLYYKRSRNVIQKMQHHLVSNLIVGLDFI